MRMDFTDEWQGERFRVGAYISDALLYLKMTGMVDLDSLYQGMAYAAGVGSQRAYGTVLVDFRRAVLTVSEDELLGLKIRQPTMAPNSVQVWLDDREISHGLTGVSVEWSVDDVITAYLSILIDDLDVDAETLAVLQARLDEKVAASNGVAT